MTREAVITERTTVTLWDVDSNTTQDVAIVYEAHTEYDFNGIEQVKRIVLDYVKVLNTIYIEPGSLEEDIVNNLMMFKNEVVKLACDVECKITAENSKPVTV